MINSTWQFSYGLLSSCVLKSSHWQKGMSVSNIVLDLIANAAEENELLTSKSQIKVRIIAHVNIVYIHTFLLPPNYSNWAIV